MSKSINHDLLICFSRPSPSTVFSHPCKVPEVLRSARCSRSGAALVPHDRSSGFTRLLQQIISERKGCAEQLQSARGAVLGERFRGGYQKVGFGEQILEGL